MRILFKLNPYLQQRQREKKRNIFPILLAMYATYLRNQGDQIVWDGTDDGTYDKVITSEMQIDIPFLQLPHADRVLTDALNPKWQRNGNFKHHAGTYIQSSNTCWYKKCSFCLETILNKPYELRSVDDVIAEIRECKRLKYREIFDDAATFATGAWRDEFVRKLRHLDITFSCNMRFGTKPDFKAMRDAGFRMLLYGLESANQKTLDKVNKGVNIDKAVEEIMLASRYGLEPHIAYIVSYPWETEKDMMKTINLVRWLLVKGYAKTAQCSFYAPPDGQERGNEAYRNYVNKHYDVVFNPLFWYNKIIDIRSIDDFKYLIRGIKEGVYAKTNCFRKVKM